MATKTDDLIARARDGDTDARAYLVMEASVGNREARAYLDTEAPEVVPEPRTEVETPQAPEDARVNPGDVWTQLVRADGYLRLEALVTATALARLADLNLEVRISQRSLTDAVDRPDVDGRRSKFVRTGLKYLVERGWVQHLNPSAVRAERGHYRLAIPMSQWPF